LSAVEERIVKQIQSILESWHVTYNVADEKYVAKADVCVVLDSEQIEWIGNMGLRIFSVQKYGDTIIVRFSSGGGY